MASIDFTVRGLQNPEAEREAADRLLVEQVQTNRREVARVADEMEELCAETRALHPQVLEAVKRGVSFDFEEEDNPEEVSVDWETIEDIGRGAEWGLLCICGVCAVVGGVVGFVVRGLFF